jgi:hypothetical protein
VAGLCESGDEPSGSIAMELICWLPKRQILYYSDKIHYVMVQEVDDFL